MNSKQTVSRNAACPCGSGLRYKNCHGDLKVVAGPTPATVGLLAAKERLSAHDLDAVEVLCRSALTEAPEHPEALFILSRCEYERGRTAEGLRLALRAVGALAIHPLSPAAEFPLWGNLNAMFTQALTGLDSVFAARRRSEYASWSRSTACDPANPDNSDKPDDPLVTVVIVDPGDKRGAGAALASVSRQTWRNLELVIAYAGGDLREDAEFAAAMRDCPFPMHWLALPGAREAVLADAGVRAATGSFVNVLATGHEFAATRLETMLRNFAERGSDWGFSNVAFIDAAGRRIKPEQDARVGSWSARLAAIPEANTIGYTFIQQTFIAVDAGNLFFRRSLYDATGGFRNLHFWAWDFCLRALWLSEPAYVSSAEYRHRVIALATDARPIADNEGRAQIAMFAEFYARACRDDCVPPNPFAPSITHWQMNFLKSVFAAAHVLALPITELEHLGDVVLERLSTRPSTAIEPGIDLVGFAYAELGLGEALRSLAKACVAGRISFGVRDVDLRIQTRQADRSLAAHITDDLRHRCSVFCLNPDMMKPIRNLMANSAAAGRLNIGYWFWELERLPREWEIAIDDVDEIWVSSRFIAAAMQRSTSKPVVLIPVPIDVTPSRQFTRTEFGLPNDRFLFLFSFDFNSFTSRKNPDGVIAAFRLAFPPARRDVGLVIKSINAANQPEKMRALQELIGGDDRIVINDGFFTRDQISGLQSVIDTYVSLHRAEGLGLGLAESMYQGKPVIGTGYSGNLEFMNEANSALVDYSLVPIRKGEYLYDDPGFFWAEPDEEHAAHLMRRMVDDQPYRQGMALRGKNDIRERFSYAATAERMLARLKSIGVLDVPGPRTPAAPPPKREFAMASMRYISQKEDDRVGTAKPLLLPDVLDTVYLARLPRPKFVHLLSKSLPRSGHHHLVEILSRLYGKALEYCEFYQTASSVCCKQQLCTNMCNPERMSNGPRNVSMQKSHDFNLDDPMLEPRTWLKYVVIVRPFTPAVSSEVKLFLINHFSQFLEAHQILARSIFQLHDKQLYRRALGLIDAAELRPDRQAVKSFLSQRYGYHRSFRAKWQSFKERNPEDVTCIEYDDLVGARRTETIDALVSMIGIEPDVSVATALGAEPAMTDRERGLEVSRVVNEILEENRDLLNQCEALLSRPPADLASQNIE